MQRTSTSRELAPKMPAKSTRQLSDEEIARLEALIDAHRRIRTLRQAIQLSEESHEKKMRALRAELESAEAEFGRIAGEVRS